MQPILLEAHLRSFNRRKDGSVSLNFSSNKEITNEDFATIDKLFQQNGWLMFKENEPDTSEIPSDDAGGMRISPSQSLRNKIFALYKKKGDESVDFPTYYKRIVAGFEMSVQNQIDRLG